MRSSFLDKVNPSLKSITLILCCVIMAAGGSWKINAAVIIACVLSLIFLSRCNLRTMISLYIPLLALGGLIFLSSLMSHDTVSAGHAVSDMASFDTALLLGTRILSYASIGILFGLTTDNKLFAMSLMQQMHLPPKFAYGVLAALHLVPTLRREWDEVQLAYAVRRKHSGVFPFGPLFTTLVNGVRWSENVAMAMESKGFDGDGKRTHYITTPVRTADLIYTVCCLGIMIVFFIVLR